MILVEFLLVLNQRVTTSITTLYVLQDRCQEETQKINNISLQEEGHPPVRLQMYRDSFNYEFNLGFHVSKKDICDMCEKFRMTSDTEKAAMQASYNLHQQNKNLSWKNKEEDDKEREKQMLS